MLEALCGAAQALGIASLRAPLLALRAARAAAALAGRDRITEEDAALAARLVLGPRATQRPEAAEPPPARAAPARGHAAARGRDPAADPSPMPRRCRTSCWPPPPPACRPAC